MSSSASFIKNKKIDLLKSKWPIIVTTVGAIVGVLVAINISNEALHPDFMPMIMPPRKWDNPFVGGYYGKKYNEENTVEGVKNALQHAKAKK